MGEESKTDYDKRIEEQIRKESIKAEINEIQNQLQAISEKITELNVVFLSMDELKKHKNREILLPVGSGFFMKGTISGEESVLVNVGADVVIPKSFESAKETIKNQREELELLNSRLNKELEKIALIMQGYQ